MSYYLKLLNGPHEGRTVKIKEGYIRMGKIDGSPLPFEYDNSLFAETFFSIYAVKNRLFFKPSSEEEISIIDIKTKNHEIVSSNWQEVEGDIVMVFGKTMVLVNGG
ncbi:MAG: hypothetical protein IID16_12615 [Candidatus Marinimicrobia bacterium]|nr:hypothetical protein [Candidatus Neomarinimicrobiota bacterium]